jgi:hypothetical protein
VDADKTRRDDRGLELPKPQVVDLGNGSETEAGMRAALDESPVRQAEPAPKPRTQRRAVARLNWLEEQLEVRDEAIARLVPDWSPGSSSIPPEQAVVMALDELMSENAQAVKAATLARKQAKEALGRGQETGALVAVVALGLFASAVALVYAVWQNFHS